MEITQIERIGRKGDRYLVYIDGERTFTIHAEDYFKLNLYEKKKITKEEIEFIKTNIIYSSAKSKATRYVSFTLRCEGQIRNKLKLEGYDIEVIDRVIEDLKSLGYINDKMYVQKYLYDRIKLKPKSKKLLRYELQKKGVSLEDIDEVLSSWKMNEQDVVEGLIKKKFGKYDLSNPKIIKRVYSFLGHRGFSTEIINDALNNMM
jgi:regulatory protein